MVVQLHVLSTTNVYINWEKIIIGGRLNSQSLISIQLIMRGLYNVSKAAQLLSDSGVRAIWHYRAHRKFAFPFKGSENTEKFTKLMNDVFDIINGRCVKQGINISNWLKKEEKLYRHLSTNFVYYRGVSPVKKTSWFQYSSQHVCIEDYLESLANPC